MPEGASRPTDAQESQPSAAKGNGTANAADFRAAAEAEAFGEPERVVLPKSGFPVMLRRPKARAFVLAQAALPQSLAARVFPATPSESEPEPEDVEAYARFWAWLFQKVFVKPRLSLDPGPEEIHPNWILPDDQDFLLRWMVGEVASDGSDLARFRGEEAAGPAAPGASGAELRDAAAPAPGSADAGLPAHSGG